MKTKVHKPPKPKLQVKQKKIVADPQVPIPSYARDIVKPATKPKRSSSPFSGQKRVRAGSTSV